MCEEAKAAGESEARRQARALLESYLFESGFYTPEMAPRGRLIAEVFAFRGAEFPSDYLEASGQLDPGVAVRLHDTCTALYDGRFEHRGSLGRPGELAECPEGVCRVPQPRSMS